MSYERAKVGQRWFSVSQARGSKFMILPEEVHDRDVIDFLNVFRLLLCPKEVSWVMIRSHREVHSVFSTWSTRDPRLNRHLLGYCCPWHCRGVTRTFVQYTFYCGYNPKQEVLICNNFLTDQQLLLHNVLSISKKQRLNCYCYDIIVEAIDQLLFYDV